MLISVWWSFYIDVVDEAGVAAAIEDVEVLLGHKIQVNGISHDEFVQNYADAQGRDSLFHVDAWSSLRVESIEQAAVHTLKQVQKLDSEINTYEFRPPPPDDENDGFISLYWWYNKEGRLLPQFLSTGVQLYIPIISTWDKKGCDGTDEEDKEYCLEYLERKRTMPVVTLPAPDNRKANYIVLYEVIVKTSSHQKLMARHWPKLQQKFTTEVTLTNLQKPANNQDNFHFTVRQELNDMTEQEAIITCLSITGGTVKIEHDKAGRMTRFGTVDNTEEAPPEWQGIFGFRLTARAII